MARERLIVSRSEILSGLRKLAQKEDENDILGVRFAVNVGVSVSTAESIDIVDGLIDRGLDHIKNRHQYPHPKCSPPKE